MNPTLYFYLNEPKKSSKNGQVPVYMRIIQKGKKAEMRLPYSVSDTQRKLWNPMLMRFNDRKFPANDFMDNVKRAFDDFVNQNATKLNQYNAAAIKSKIMGSEDKEDIPVLQFVKDYLKTAIEPKAEMKPGTKRNYRKAVTHFENFLEYSKQSDVTIGQSDFGFACAFKDYLLGTFPEIKKVGMKEASALDNIKRFRTIFERAVDLVHIKVNPFRKIRLSAKSGIKDSLTIHEVQRLYYLDLAKMPNKRIYRDLFLFSVFTGLAFTDLISLAKSNLSSTPGNVHLLINRLKTDIITEMFLPKQAISLIDNYQNQLEAKISNCVFPKRSNEKYNAQLKVLADLVDISKNVTTHTARRTFRQLLAEADVTDMGVIKRMMGHSIMTDIDGKYYKPTETTLLEAKRKFEIYLDKHLS